MKCNPIANMSKREKSNHVSEKESSKKERNMMDPIEEDQHLQCYNRKDRLPLIVRFSLVTLLLSLAIISIQSNPLDSNLPQSINKLLRANANSRQTRQPVMQSNLGPNKEASSSQIMSNASSARSKQRRAVVGSTVQLIPKRFKTTLNNLKTNVTTNQNLIGMNSTNRIQVSSLGDLNNNEISNMTALNDVNNNTIPSSSDIDVSQQSWRRNVNSINGTIDLSQYEQSDVDRLYGDALLVYLKNFNETLPARRELISVNGTTNRVPIYRSERKARKVHG